MKKLLLILSICLGGTVNGKEVPKDSLDIRSNHQFGTEKQLSIRAGVGVQKSFYTEMGVALHKCNYGDIGFFSNDFYSALEWNRNKKQDLYGIKIGYEANTFLLLLNFGVELKYLTDFKEKDVVITPKVGFGIFGDVNLFYGFNISTNNRPFEEVVGSHQLSVVFNFNNHFLRYR